MEDVLVNNGIPAGVCTSVCGGSAIGESMSRDKRINVLSFTGSTQVIIIIIIIIINKLIN